jgi:hypothetical protein
VDEDSGGQCDNSSFECGCIDDASTTGIPSGSCTSDQNCSPHDANIGDPDMAMVVPSEQFRDKYVFLVPTKYQHNYVSIVAPVVAGVVANVVMDGAAMDPATFHQVGSQPWAVATKSMMAGSHVLSADQNIGVLVYGWDQYVSYSYPGGMNLETLQIQH